MRGGRFLGVASFRSAEGEGKDGEHLRAGVWWLQPKSGDASRKTGADRFMAAPLALNKDVRRPLDEPGEIVRDAVWARREAAPGSVASTKNTAISNLFNIPDGVIRDRVKGYGTGRGRLTSNRRRVCPPQE